MYLSPALLNTLTVVTDVMVGTRRRHHAGSCTLEPKPAIAEHL